MQVLKDILQNKRNLLLAILFIFGAYAAIQSVLTRGESLPLVENVALEEVKIDDEQAPNIKENNDFARVLGDRVVNSDGLFQEDIKNIKVNKKIKVEKVENLATESDESPKIVLGYKEDFNETWDPCSNLALAESLGLNTANCTNQEEVAEEEENNTVTISHGGGGGGSVNIPTNPTEEEEQLEIVNEEPEEDGDPVYASSSQALLTSFKIGGQEVMGKRGSESMSFTQSSYKSGAMLLVEEPYTFKGVEIETATNFGELFVYIYQAGSGWSTWDSSYPGAEEDLANFVLSNKAVVMVKVVSEDFSTTNWYKAKVFDPNNLEVIPSFLTKFEVGGRNVLPLLDLQMDFHSLNMVDFGATLLFPDFTELKGVTVDLDNWDNFTETKVLIYEIGWSTWDLQYEGAIEDLAQVTLKKDQIIVLKLQDKDSNIFYYRVNLFEGLEEATEVSPIHPQEERILNSDNSLRSLLVGGKELINLPDVKVGDTWHPSSTGAVLTVESLDDFIGVVPQVNDEQSIIKVRIYRDAWITWEYELGLDLVAKEPILANDRIVIEVTAQDGSQMYYQVQVALKTRVENPPVQTSSTSVLAEEAIKPEQIEELKTENTDNDNSDLKLEPEEKIEISSDNQINVE